MDNEKMYKIIDTIGLVLQLIAIIWNVLLLVVLCRLKTIRRSYFSLVKSLTVADLLLPFTLLMYILYLQYIFLDNFAETFFMISVVNTYSMCVIVLHLICLAAEHYVAVIKPLRYEAWCRCRYVVCRIILCWTSPLLIATIEITDNISEMYIVLIKSGLTVLCFLIMLIVYILILREVRTQQRLENSQNRHARKNYRALITTILNLVTFFLCWMPFVVGDVYWFLYDEYGYGSVLYESSSFTFFEEIARNILCVNSVCDALIYSIRLTEVRKVWRRTFCCINSRFCGQSLTKK